MFAILKLRSYEKTRNVFGDIYGGVGRMSYVPKRFILLRKYYSKCQVSDARCVCVTLRTQLRIFTHVAVLSTRRSVSSIYYLTTLLPISCTYV